MMRILAIISFLLLTSSLYAKCPDFPELGDSFNQELVNRAKLSSINKDVIKPYKVEQAFMSAAVVIDDDNAYVVMYQLSVKAQGHEDLLKYNGSIVYERHTCRLLSDSDLAFISDDIFKYH